MNDTSTAAARVSTWPLMITAAAILTITMGKKRHVALAHIALWALVQFLSEVASLRHGVLRSDLPRAWAGRLRGFFSCLCASVPLWFIPDAINHRDTEAQSKTWK